MEENNERSFKELKGVVLYYPAFANVYTVTKGGTFIIAIRDIAGNVHNKPISEVYDIPKSRGKVLILDVMYKSTLHLQLHPGAAYIIKQDCMSIRIVRASDYKVYALNIDELRSKAPDDDNDGAHDDSPFCIIRFEDCVDDTS